MEKIIAKAGVLIEALPYIQSFRDSIVVIKFGGSIMEDEQRIRSVLRDIVFMECAGMKPVLVHGGGKAISARLQQEAIETRFINGLRYTCERTIRIVDDVLHNNINASLVRIMEEFDGKPYAVSGKNVLRCEKTCGSDADSGEPIDLGFVGEVVNVDTTQIRWILDRRQVPVITPLGRDMLGNCYNINADMAACRIAAELKAAKLVFLSDVPGILNGDQLISTVACGEIETLIRNKVITGGMVPKVRSASDALNAGTGKVHMIDGRIQHSLLLEIFTDAGVGTQIIH